MEVTFTIFFQRVLITWSRISYYKNRDGAMHRLYRNDVKKTYFSSTLGPML